MAIIENWIPQTFGLLCVLLVTSAQTPGLRCYKCVSQAGDNTCLEDPERMATSQIHVDCEGGWCTTTRKEFTEVPGKIVTFQRGCEESRPTYLDNIIHNPHFTTYYTTCRTMRCNNGDGLKENSGGGGGGDNSGVIIVNGESKATLVRTNVMFSWYVSIVCLLYFSIS